jgi:hypothetical protein
MEEAVSRIYNPDSAGKERTRLCKCVVLSIRELMKQSEPDEKSRDLAAFIGLALISIYDTVDTSVQAWEKRGYWVKADRFRMDWEWTKPIGENICSTVLADDWSNLAMLAVKVGQKLMNVEVSAHHRLGTPWVGAWKRLKDIKS